MKNHSSLNLKELLYRFDRPYKHTTEYEIYGDSQRELPKRSVFWKTHIGYVARYKHASFKTNNSNTHEKNE